MKKLLLFLLISVGLNAQFNYQAIVKDSDGNPVTNNQVKFKFSMMYQSSTASPVFVEEHDLITPPDGVVNLSVGGGTVVNGTFSNIDWSQSVFMKEELDTGSGYQDMGTRQIASVPVAEYAKRVAGLNTISSTINLDSNISSFNTTGVVSASSFRGNADQTTLTYSGTVTNVLAVISDLQRQIAELKELVNAGICLPKLSHQIDDYSLAEGFQAHNGEIYGMIDFCPQNNSGTASVTITGTVPNGLSFNWDDGTMDYKLVGTPAVGTAGTYSLTVVASIGSTTLTDDFVLTITSCDFEEDFMTNRAYYLNSDYGGVENIESYLLNQTIITGGQITPFEISYLTNCPSNLIVSSEGLPNGVTVTKTLDGKYQVDGRVSNSGTYNYTITAALLSNTLTISGTIRVSSTLTGNIEIDSNNLTIKCPNSDIGYTQIINGKEHKVVDKVALQMMIKDDEDVTCVCTSQITDMTNLITVNNNFNQDIGAWDTSSVTNMRGLFGGAKFFNQDISLWDTSNVTDMSFMFSQAKVFNQPIGDWDLSNVTNMSCMFQVAEKFNQPIGDWDVSNVTDMSLLFRHATDFNQPIGNWNVSNVTDMSNMFTGKYSGWLASGHPNNVDYHNFNQDISSWDVSNVTDMGGMFGTSKFNQPIGNWNVSNVTKMSYMFHIAFYFSQDISSWDVSNVTEMGFMFRYAQSFNKNISSWCVSNIIEEPHLFSDATTWSNSNKPVWGTCPP